MPGLRKIRANMGYQDFLRLQESRGKALGAEEARRGRKKGRVIGCPPKKDRQGGRHCAKIVLNNY